MLMMSGRRREGALAIPSLGLALDELWISLPSNDYRDAIVGFESEMTLSPLSPSVGGYVQGYSPGRIRGAPEPADSEPRFRG